MMESKNPKITKKLYCYIHLLLTGEENKIRLLALLIYISLSRWNGVAGKSEGRQ